MKAELKRKIIVTDDGSHTIHLPQWDEQYHSKHGAIQEALHVFIKNGLSLFENQSIEILEIGFGTGLNCYISYLQAAQRNIKIHYVGIEAYPVERHEIEKLNYTTELKDENDADIFDKMHQEPWNEKISLSPTFELTKKLQFFNEISTQNTYHLIYFDAFGPRVQPDLWTDEIFKKMYNALKTEGVLVTYSAKGSVRRAMQKVGFKVEKLPGPPGKREMLRATKP